MPNMQLAKKRDDYLEKFSIGIPTYEAGESLVTVINSLISQTAFNKIDKILIAVDGNKIPAKIVKKISHKKVKIFNFKTRQGQSARINDLFRLSKNEKLILTNDDVILEKNAVELISKEYRQFDLVAANIKSLTEKTSLEKALMFGQNLRTLISKKWNNGDNYLSCNGRLIILSKKLYKKITIPKNVWNNDAYIYLESQNLKLKFAYADDLIAYCKTPATIREHLSQSSKFQKSPIDLQRFFEDDISGFYKIPVNLIIISIMESFVKNPIAGLIYTTIFIYTRLRSYFMKSEFKVKSFWETDLSTKSLPSI